MTVYDYALTDAQLEAGRARMKKATFTAANLSQALVDAGVPHTVRSYYGVAARAADRLIQHHRKWGDIRFTEKRCWVWKK
jgi:hypothetical protein